MSTPTAPASGLGFSMLFPPGWREFRTDVESERELTELATRGARDAGRADVALAIRQHIHRMFEGLRRRRALGDPRARRHPELRLGLRAIRHRHDYRA